MPEDTSMLRTAEAGLPLSSQKGDGNTPPERRRGDFNALVWRRIKADPEFARAVLAGAARDFLEGDHVTAQLLLRDYVNATLGFEELGRRLGKSPKSLMRMLSVKGNPRADNLCAILKALQEHEGITLTVKAA